MGPFPPQPQISSTQGTRQLGEFSLAGSLSLLLSLPLSAKLLGSESYLCPQASSKGPILSCRSDGSNSINGKQDEWYPVPKVYEARQNRVGGAGAGKCCWNSLSFGALLGLERATALAKTCFCQQKPRFTNIQQQKNL